MREIQRWSRAEDAVIRRYRDQGAYRIRKQLRTMCGTDRTIEAIRMRASRKGVSLAKYRQCDVCGTVLNSHNNSGKCPDCNLADRIENMQQRKRHLESLERKEADTELRRIYNAERQAVRRMENRLKKVPKKIRRFEQAINSFCNSNSRFHHIRKDEERWKRRSRRKSARR